MTFSIGVLICHVPPKSAEALIMLADELMYSIKKTGKNAVRYATYPDPAISDAQVLLELGRC